MKAKLTRITSAHALLRTDEVTGYAITPPAVGELFVMYAEPLSEAEGLIRWVRTSVVTEVTSTGFKTLNSVYNFEALAG